VSRRGCCSARRRGGRQWGRDRPAVDALATEDPGRPGFGAIRLDADGVVTRCSKLDRHLPGYRKEKVGRNFFGEIAPCTDNPQFRGRIERAGAGGRLDIASDWSSDMPNAMRDVELRVCGVSASGGGVWILMRRDA